MTATYSTEAGWERIAGLDVLNEIVGKKGRETLATRYLFCVHKAEKKAVILTAKDPKRTDWSLFLEGKIFDLAQQFDKLDTAPRMGRDLY